MKIMYKNTYNIYSCKKYMNYKNLSKSDIFKTEPLQPLEQFNSFSIEAIKILLQKTNWQLLGFYKIFNNLFLTIGKFKFFTILLLYLRSKLIKNTYYLIPKI